MVRVIRRAIGAQGIVLDALRWDTPVGPALRLWLKRGVQAKDAALPPGPVRLHAKAVFTRNLILSGTCPKGELDLPFAAGAQRLMPAAPETDLLKGHTVLVAQRHREPVEIALAWLRFHVAEQGMEAAVIIDRTPPGPAHETFASAIAGADIPGLTAVLLVNCATPLGYATQPAYGDPLSARRVKKGGTAPEPEAWTAPLSEDLIYDSLMWRFLARAQAVATLDLNELAARRAGEPTLFEAAARSHGGVIALAGEAIFPWRVRNGYQPGFGDHICRVDPPLKLPKRWAAVPARGGPDVLWTPNAIIGMSDFDDETAVYQRHMCVVFSQSPVQDVINKAELVEDAALVARAEARFGAKPIRPPARAAPSPVPITVPRSDRVVIVTCMKNEGPFILEWVAFHRMIGVDDFLIYTNDCSDGTDRMLDLLQARGLVHHRDNPFRALDKRPQHAALGLAPTEPVVRDAGWILPIDVDEFVNIHVGEGTLADLFGAVPQAEALSMTWRLFGNADRDCFEDALVTEQYTRCAPHLIRRPHQAWGFKTLYRNVGLFAEMGVHRPKGVARGQKLTWLNGSGQKMPPNILRSGWRSGVDSYGYDLVTLNHYSVRDAESFLVKRARGRVNHVTRDQGEAYWFRMNNNAETDRAIQARHPALRAAMADLLDDPELAAAHHACVAAHRAQIAALRAEPDYAALYTSLTSDRMKRLSRLHRHFGMNVFLNGPRVIPDKVAFGDLPEGFFFNTGPPEGRAAD